MGTRTGYTARLIEKEQTFEDFALDCAKSFILYDFDINEPLPDTFKSASEKNYYAEKIKEIQESIENLKKMTQKEQIDLFEKEVHDNLEDNKKSIIKLKKENKKFDKMIEEVKKWTPPTKAHEGLKDFMLGQLESSKNDLSYYEEAVEEYKETLKNGYEKYIDERMKWLEKDLAYYTKTYNEENKGCENKTEWVKQLKESLNLKEKQNV